MPKKLKIKGYLLGPREILLRIPLLWDPCVIVLLYGRFYSLSTPSVVLVTRRTVLASVHRVALGILRGRLVVPSGGVVVVGYCA